jgi:hypothetical protein
MWKSWFCFRKFFVPADQLGSKLAVMLKPDQVTAEQETGTSLKATVTARSHFTGTFPWTIDQSVTPSSLNIVPGGTGTALHVLRVSKGAAVEEAFIDGQVSIINNGAAATQDLAISINLVRLSSSTAIAPVLVDTGRHPVLAPGESHLYNYRIDIPAGSILPNETYKITADITVANYLGHFGSPFGPSPSDTAVLPAAPTLINDTVHVDNTNNKSYTFNSSSSREFRRVFTCDDTGTNINTATIRETGRQASASVMVICECSTMVNETVCVQADITITPNLGVGIIKTFCDGDPIIGVPGKALVEECTFTVSQNICVQIPLAFSVEASALPAGIVCRIPTEWARNAE